MRPLKGGGRNGEYPPPLDNGGLSTPPSPTEGAPMKPFISDTDVLPIDCPGCKQPLGQTLGRLKAQPHFVCPGCGAEIDTTKFVEGMLKAQKAVDEFGVTLDKLNRRL